MLYEKEPTGRFSQVPSLILEQGLTWFKLNYLGVAFQANQLWQIISPMLLVDSLQSVSKPIINITHGSHTAPDSRIMLLFLEYVKDVPKKRVLRLA
jgi:hypothetical protein